MARLQQAQVNPPRSKSNRQRHALRLLELRPSCLIRKRRQQRTQEAGNARGGDFVGREAQINPNEEWLAEKWVIFSRCMISIP